MKKHIKLFLSLLLIISTSCLFGCSSSSDAESGSGDGSQSGSYNNQTSGNSPSETNEGGESASGNTSLSSGSAAKEQQIDVTGLPDILDTIQQDDGDKLILVNKLHTLSSDYEPTDMVAVDGSLSTNQGLYFKREAYDAYLKMLSDAKNQGISFMICSTYRSYQTQDSIYHNYVSMYGADYANTISAYPGRSEHQTGWAVDITSASMGYGLAQNFIEYPEGIWISNHCSEYGFIVRYPKDKTNITGYSYEPWHLRYVGVDVAKEITEKGLTLEEYIWNQSK